MSIFIRSRPSQFQPNKIILLEKADHNRDRPMLSLFLYLLCFCVICIVGCRLIGCICVVGCSRKVTFDAPLTITTNQTVDLSTEQTTDGSDETEAADETAADGESTDAEAADTTDGAAAENADAGADAGGAG